MTRFQVLGQLRKATRRAGSQRAWARQHGVSAAYVSDVLLGRRNPGSKILEPLGLVQRVTYSVEYVRGPGDA